MNSSTTTEWRTVLHWHNGYQLDLRDKIGLYRVIRDGELMFIGHASSLPGGLAKRLAAIAKGPDYFAAQLIYMHRDKVVIQVLELNDRMRVLTLSKELIKRYQPRWNAKRQSI